MSRDRIVFLPCGRLSQLRTDFHQSIFWAALQHICTFFCVCFSMNICTLLCTFIVLFASFLDHQYCMRAHHISLYRESIHAPSFYVSKLHCNFYESRRAYFPKSIYLQSCFSQTNNSAILKKFLKIKTPTRKKCSKSKVLFPTLFTEHLFWSHRIRFNVHAKKSFFLKRAVHFLTNCQKVNIVFFTLFQDFSVKCRIDMFSLGCEVESGCTNPFT